MRMTIGFSFRKVVTVLLPATILTGCSGFEGSAPKVPSLSEARSRLDGASVTFDRLATASETLPGPGAGAPTPGPGSPATGTPVPTIPISITPEKVKKCEQGELDLIDIAAKCKGQQDLLLTVAQNGAETVLYKARLGASRAPAEALLKKFDAAVVADSWVDVFICVDSNGNGRCGDEEIRDLNEISADLLAFRGKLDQGNFDFCSLIDRGNLFYHSQQRLVKDGTNGTRAINNGRAAGDWAQELLSNLPPVDGPSGSDRDIRIPLVQHDANLCPRPQPRTDGCFVKGTEISVTKKATIAIEKLAAGNPVLLADGRTVRIKKVVVGPEPEPVIAFEMKSGSKLTVTSLHPLLTSRGLKLAKDIAIGDELRAADGKWTPIVSITSKPYDGQVYNFELDGENDADHLVIAEGVVSGELYLQNKLSRQINVIGLLDAKRPY